MKRRTRKNFIGLFLMLTIFPAFVGYFILYKPLQAARATETWAETGAVILSSKLTTLPNGKGDPLYRVDVSYRYEWQGKSYTSRRYALYDQGTRSYDAKAAAVQRLVPGSTVTCYVNPAQPGEAILNRAHTNNFTVWKIVIGVFIVGLAGFIWSLSGFFVKAHPLVGEPWRTRADWVAGRIKAKPTTAVTVLWILALVFLLFGGVCAGLATKQHIPYPQGFIIWLFPAAGVGLTIWACRIFARWRRFHNAIFEMPVIPAPVGGILTGTIHLNQLLHADAGFRLRLRCYRRGSDNKEYVLSQTDQSVAGGLMDGFPVSISIPAGAQPSTSDGEGGWPVFWRLEADAGNINGDFVAGFEVPIFVTDPATHKAIAQPLSQLATPNLRDLITAIKSGGLQPAQPVAPGKVELPAHSRIRVTTALTGNREIIIGPFRSFGYMLGFPALMIAWTALTVGLWKMHGLPLPLRIGFTFFDVIMVIACFSSLLGRSSITADCNTLTVAHNLFRGGRRHSVSAGDIVAIEKRFSGSAQLQEVIAKHRDGHIIRLATNIRDPLEADWLVNEISAALGLAKHVSPDR